MSSNDSLENSNTGKATLSVESSRTSPNTVSETSSGLNGDKEMEIDETSSEDNKEMDSEVAVKKDESEIEAELSSPLNKKRKFDEVDRDNLSDSSPIDFLGFPDTRTEEEKEKSREKKEKDKPVIKSDSVLDSSAFGKGKRSRIPNKRYESLTIKSFAKSASRISDIFDADSGPEVTSSEDGRNDDDHDAHKLEDEVSSSAHTSPVGSRAKGSRLGSGASPATPQTKKTKGTDLSNPCYLKPFEYGWKRELVYRAALDSNMKRQGDVYYITPSGKKIRSMRELADALVHSELSVDDFTFFKEPIGLNDPEKEIIREAKLKGATTPASAKKAASKLKATKEKSVASPKVAAAAEAGNKTGKSPRLGGFKVKMPGSSRLSQGAQKNERKRAQVDSELELGMLPPVWSPKKGSAAKQSPAWQAKGADAKPRRPCSIRCQGVSGLIPTLQCRLCLCLYHKECVGESSDNVPASYVCKNCQLDNQDNIQTSFAPAPTIGPPPLTPISSLKSNHSQSATPPKLQRIPRPGDTPLLPLVPAQPVAKQNSVPKISEPLKTHLTKLSPAMSRLVKISDADSSKPSKSIVGSMTTWFPPNSTLKMNASNSPGKHAADSALAPKPQSLVFMGERKFLVVPKGNVLSISPNIGAAASTPSSKRAASPTADKAPVFELKEKSKVVEGASPAGPASASLGPPPPHESPPAAVLPPPPAAPEKSSESSALPTVLEPSDPPVDSSQVTREESARPPGETLKENQRETSPPKTRRGGTRKTPAAPTPVVKADAESRFMQNYLQNLSYGYQTLLYVFQYLKVQDLLRAGCVCTLWRDIAGHPSLWKTVRMKNSQVANWEGLADALKKHHTENLDLRKMLLPNTGDDMWPLFSKAIARVDSLVRIELCRCPASVIEELAKSNKNLQVINAVTIRCESLDIAAMDNLVNLQELRLKSTNGFVLMSDLSSLKTLTNLKHLSLTSVKELHKRNVMVIGELINLETLDLGECSDFPDNFGTDVIAKLTKLEKLRLEKGQGTCCTFNILEAVSKISSLEQLELVNFDVKTGFDKALGACSNIKKLLIIPTYISQSATTNHMVLGGVIKLKASLSHFVWGVTLELLRVTELFVDQCEESPNKEKKKPSGNGDSIPVLKPVPIMKTDDVKEDSSSKEPPQVEILPLPTLQKLLLNCLPTTRVKILKIPFHATWRQSIVDTAN